MKDVISRFSVFFFLCFFAFPVHSQEPPDPPGSLSATPGDGQVILRWSTPTDNGSPITHYEYRQRIDEDDASWSPDWTTIPASDAQTTSYTRDGLTNGTTYRFRVRAVNAVGVSEAARTKATPATSPAPPGSLSATPGDGQVILRWSIPADNGSPITHYEYRQRIDEDDASWSPDWTTIPASDAQTTRYTRDGLTNGTTYRFRVRAVNAVGASEAARTKATPVSPNRPPALDGPGAVSLAENSSDAVGTYTATDPDGDPLTWSLSGDDARAFALQGIDTTRTLHFQQPPDFETQPTYTVAVVVTDSLLSATVAVTVTVVNVDEPGTVALSSTQPRVGESITATLADPDGRVSDVGWTWSAGSGTSDGLSSTLTPTPAMVGTPLQATAHYEDGHGTGKSAESVWTEAVIDRPDSLGSLSATPGDEQVTLRWTTPADNGSPITHYEYRLSDDGGSRWSPDWTTIPSRDAQTTNYTIDDLTNGTEYTFEVRAVNAVGAGEATRTKATPVAPNRPPALDGPSAVSLAENSSDAVGTYTATDPDGDPLTWLLTGDDARAFALQGIDTTRTLHFEQPPDFETQPTYTVAVVVTDSLLSATVAVTVTVVNVDEPGTIALSSTQPRVGEPITATLADPDGRVSDVGWTWSSGSGTADGLSSTLTPTQDMVGTPLQATAHYEDGHGAGKSARSAQTEAVSGPPDPPGSLSATPGDEQVTLGWTTPADNGSPITHYAYRLSDDGGTTWDPDWTTIPSRDAETTSYTLDDLTNGTEYTFEVRAVNAIGTSEAARATATPVSPNRPPAVDGPRTVSVAENSPDAVGTYTATDPDDDELTWSLTGTDASAFRLDDTGTSRALYLRQAPDFEVQPTYTVEVVVTDGSLSATVAVTVTVSNVDEPGTVVLSSTQPRVGETITATLADPDGSVTNVGWTWSAGSGTSEGLASTLTPTPAMVGTPLQATAHYEDGQGTGKSARSAQTEAVFGPPDPPGSLSATPGDEQVTLGWTTPADNGAPITHYEYRQRADGGSKWSPDWTTIAGRDAETTSYTVERLTNGTEYTFEVRTVNAVGAGDAVQAKATPVAPNRPPTLDGPTEVSMAENSPDAVATYTATDPDDDELTWSLTGTDASAFRLDDTGTSRALYFRQAPDFEVQPTYTVEVVVTDGSLSATVAVTVTVSNVDEPGTIALSSTQPRVGEPITATLTDPDGRVTEVGWTWSAGSGTADGLSSTLNITPAMVGTPLQATAHYDDGQGPGKSARSVQTEAVIGSPDSPGSLSATPGHKQVTLRWRTPADNGSPITHYEYRRSDDGGRRWQPDWTPIPSSDAQTTSYTLDDLTNGTEYTVAVRAVNAVGAGPAARTTATPVPHSLTLDGPRAVSIDENSTEAVGTYTALDPEDTILGPDAGELTWLLSGQDAFAFALQGRGPTRTLHFRQAPDFEAQPTYAVEVVLTDNRSLSASVQVTVTVVNVEEPGTIALSTTQPRVGEPITAVLTDPDGGVTSVGWRWSAGSGTAEGLASTLTPTPAMVGTRLQATATYEDGHGTGKSARSAQTEAVSGPPDPPGSLSARPGDEQVTLRWTTPADNGAPITHYAYRLSDDEGITWDPDWTTIPNSDAQTTSYTRAGLTNGTAYLFEVRAVNAAGNGSARRAAATPATVPDAVADLKATPRPGQVVLDWAAPASDGGAPITDYEYRYSRDSHDTWTDAEPAWVTVPGGSSTQTVSGLTNGTEYTFAVRAVNAAGEGPARRVSATPVVSAPGPVRHLKATPGDGQVTLGWAVPLSDGGTPITHYQYQRRGGRWTTVSGGGAARRQTVSGLTNGTTYTFSVRAVNSVGVGPSRSTTGTPVSSPDPPDPPDPNPCVLSLSASPSGTSVSLRWSTSGACKPISSYQCRRDRGSWSDVGTSTSKTETGLQRCNSYTFSVQALSGSNVEASASRSVTLKSPGSVSLTTTSPVVGKPVTAMLTDPDGGITGASWTWRRLPSSQSAASTPYPELSSYTPSASDVGRRLQASVTYRDNCSPDNQIDSQASSSRTAPVKAAAGKPVSLQAMPDSVLAAIAAPNPFNPTTTLHIQLPVSGPVSLTIYNMAGQGVRSLWDHHVLKAGYHAIDWDGRDSQGHPVTSGVYLYQLRIRKQVLMNKMVLIR